MGAASGGDVVVSRNSSISGDGSGMGRPTAARGDASKLR